MSEASRTDARAARRWAAVRAQREDRKRAVRLRREYEAKLSAIQQDTQAWSDTLSAQQEWKSEVFGFSL